MSLLRFPLVYSLLVLFGVTDLVKPPATPESTPAPAYAEADPTAASPRTTATKKDNPSLKSSACPSSAACS